jgi:transposase
MVAEIWWFWLGIPSAYSNVKTPEQKILELEVKVKLLVNQKARAEYLTEHADKKVIVFDMLLDMDEKEYDT